MVTLEHTKPMVSTIEVCLREMHIVDALNPASKSFLLKATGRFDVSAKCPEFIITDFQSAATATDLSLRNRHLQSQSCSCPDLFATATEMLSDPSLTESAAVVEEDDNGDEDRPPTMITPVGSQQSVHHTQPASTSRLPRSTTINYQTLPGRRHKTASMSVVSDGTPARMAVARRALSPTVETNGHAMRDSARAAATLGRRQSAGMMADSDAALSAKVRVVCVCFMHTAGVRPSYDTAACGVVRFHRSQVHDTNHDRRRTTSTVRQRL